MSDGFRIEQLKKWQAQGQTTRSQDRELQLLESIAEQDAQISFLTSALAQKEKEWRDGLDTIVAMLEAAGVDFTDLDSAEDYCRAIGQKPSDVIKFKLAQKDEALRESRDFVLEEAAKLCETKELMWGIRWWNSTTKAEVSRRTAHDLATEIRKLKAALSAAPRDETCWVAQDSREFFGKEVVSFKSNHGEWGFAYGTELSGVLAVETLVAGFASEEEAFQAGHNYCYANAEESAVDQCYEQGSNND